jgi:hypothetical protein
MNLYVVRGTHGDISDTHIESAIDKFKDDFLREYLWNNLARYRALVSVRQSFPSMDWCTQEMGIIHDLVKHERITHQLDDSKLVLWFRTMGAIAFEMTYKIAECNKPKSHLLNQVARPEDTPPFYPTSVIPEQSLPMEVMEMPMKVT